MNPEETDKYLKYLLDAKYNFNKTTQNTIVYPYENKYQSYAYITQLIKYAKHDILILSDKLFDSKYFDSDCLFEVNTAINRGVSIKIIIKDYLMVLRKFLSNTTINIRQIDEPIQVGMILVDNIHFALFTNDTVEFHAYNGSDAEQLYVAFYKYWKKMEIPIDIIKDQLLKQ
jgi:hypothetical protein